MTSSILWAGILPLLAFVIMDSFLGIRAGLIAAIVLAIAEAIYTYITFGELDVVTLSSVLLVVVMAIVAFVKNKPIFFKFQPVILSVAIGFLLLITYWFNHPLLYEMMIKYQSKLPPMAIEQLNNQAYVLLLKNSSHYLGYFFIAHGIVVAWSALKLSNWWWIIIRGIGFWIFMAMGIVASTIVTQLNLSNM